MDKFFYLNNRAFPVFIIFIISLFIYLPLLIFPHWGLYSDAGQIILNGRNFWSSPLERLDVVKGYWRPVFHGIDLLIYRIGGEQPWFFYISQYLFWLGTLLCTYFNCFLLSQSRWLSLVFTSFFLILSGTFEVIYTLDKGEIKIAFFIALGLALYFQQDKAACSEAEYKCLRLSSLCSLLLSIFYFILAFFTKETSHILVLNILSLPIIYLGYILILNKRKFSLNLFINERTKLNLIFLLGIFLSFLLQRSFFYLTGGAKATYLKIDYSFQATLSNIFAYFNIIPDTIYLLLVSLFSIVFVTIIYLLKGNYFANSQKVLDFSIPQSFNLIIIAFAYFLILVNFRWKLLYIWYPLYIFLLPSLCCLTSLIIEDVLAPITKLSNLLFMFLISGLFFLQVNYRLLESQAIFNFDALKDDVVNGIINYQEKRNMNKLYITLPFQSPDYAEIGERIQFFLQEKYSPSSNKLIDLARKIPFRIFNFVKYWPSNPNQFSESSTKPPDINNTKSLNLTEEVGIHIFSYIDDMDLDEVTRRLLVRYVQDSLQPNMYLLVPYGNLPNNLFFRGASLHENSVEDSLKFIPQVDWEEALTIERSFFNLSSKKLFMGWKLLKVVSVPPISWNIFSDGWLPNGTEIFYPKELLGSKLNLYGQALSPNPLEKVCSDNSARQLLGYHIQPDQQYKLTIELNCAVPVTGYDGVYSVRFSRYLGDQQPAIFESESVDKRELLYLVKKVKLDGPSATDRRTVTIDRF